MSALDDAIRSFRFAALTRERAASTALVEAYSQLWGRLRPALAALNADIAAAEARGEPVSRAWLERQARYRTLLAQTEEELRRYALFAEGVVAAQQRRAVTAALVNTERVMGAALGTPPPGVTVSFNRLPTGAIDELTGALSADSPLAALFRELAPTGAQAASEALVTGLGRGLGPRAIAREVRTALNVAPVRALRISRNEINRAYRNASLETYKANRDLLEGWVWVCSGGVRTCGVCFAKHGTLHPVDEPFASHIACFTAGHVVSGPRVVGSTVRWYEGDVIEIVTVAGNLLTVTPNHPILTPQGWIAAGLLNEGDEVIRAVGGQPPLATVNPDEYQQPALIENVARAVGRERGMNPVCVPTATLDFHGDGGGSEVCIVRADGLLRDTIDTARLQPLTQQEFSRRDMRLPFLAGQRGLALVRECARPAVADAVRGFDVATVLLGGASRHHQAIGGGRVAGVNARFYQATADNATGDAERISDGLLRLPGHIAGDDCGGGRGESIRGSGFEFGGLDGGARLPVAPQSTVLQRFREACLARAKTSGSALAILARDIGFDRVLNVHRRGFQGHVYNLQTTEGWYISNNIITHNCRCAAIPRTKSWAELGFPGIPDTRPEIEDGATLFARLPAEDQRSILGAGKYQLFKAGELALSDLVAPTRSARWGAGLRERSLGELREQERTAAD